MSRFRGLVQEFARYGVCLGLAVAADFALLATLVTWLGANYVAAAVVSFITSNALLYWLCGRFVFRQRPRAGRSFDLAIFIAVGAVTLGLQTAIMIFAVQMLHVHYLMAKVGAAGFTFLINFVIRRNVLFAA